MMNSLRRRLAAALGAALYAPPRGRPLNELLTQYQPDVGAELVRLVGGVDVEDAEPAHHLDKGIELRLGLLDRHRLVQHRLADERVLGEPQGFGPAAAVEPTLRRGPAPPRRAGAGLL